jgi:hypothetical protein
MPVLALALLAQLAVAPRPVEPVLTFPDAGLDDTTAYRGYQTRFYRDAARNTLQVYLDQRSARVLHVLADADNASVGFTARTDRGDVAALTWAAAPAEVSQRGRTRRFRHQLATDSRALHLGWFLLGSMRVERDFQYVEQAKRGFGTGPYAIPEVDRMLAALNQVPAAPSPRPAQRPHGVRGAGTDVSASRAATRRGDVGHPRAAGDPRRTRYAHAGTARSGTPRERHRRR